MVAEVESSGMPESIVTETGADNVACELCAAKLPVHASYVVRIDVFADPSLPELSTADVDELTSENQFAILMSELELMSVDEAQDQVHRRFEYKLCAACQRRFLANPLGRPRTSPIAQPQGHN